MSSEHKVHPRARLCHVIKNDNFDGYGFNLHAEKGKPGQYIGKVDDGSPAETAGLRQGDRILEVNGVSITNENHKQVVQRIKALCAETKLLVIDPEDESASTTPLSKGTADGGSVVSSGDGSRDGSREGSRDGSRDDSHDDSRDGSADGTEATEPTGNGDHAPSISSEHLDDTQNQNGGTGLNLSMTAAELRAKLAAKKKFDPRKEYIDFKKKFDVVQKL